MAHTVVVACAPTMTDLDTGAMNVNPDPDATQLVTESDCKERKEDDTIKEMMDVCSKKQSRKVWRSLK